MFGMNLMIRDMSRTTRWECEICGRGPLDQDGKELFKNGVEPHGAPWRCYEHLDQQSKERADDAEIVLEIT